MRRLAFALLLFATAACGGEDAPPDAAPDAAPDSAVSAACTDPPPPGCEEANETIDQCPSYDELCEPECNAAYECCYCEDGEWRAEITDCPPCQDAGP